MDQIIKTPYDDNNVEHNESPFAISQWQRDNPYLSSEVDCFYAEDCFYGASEELLNDGFPLETDPIVKAYQIKNVIKEFYK